MADKESSGVKLPVDAKESFLKSVEKKSKSKNAAKSETKAENEAVKEENIVEESPLQEEIPVLFDKQDEQETEVTPEKQTETKEVQETKKENKKDSDVKKDEKTDSDKKKPVKKDSKKKKADNKKKKESSKKSSDKKASDVSDKKKADNKKAENKKETVKKDKDKKDQKKKKEVIYKKLPFVKIIPIIMVLQAVLLFVIPFTSENSTFTYLMVTLFWIAVMIAGGMMLFVKIKFRNEIDSIYSSMSNSGKVYRFISLFNFFRNRKAIIADIAFFVSTALLTALIILGSKGIFDHIALTAVVLALFMLSLNMHVYFNDSIYEYSEKFIKTIEEKEVIDNE